MIIFIWLIKNHAWLNKSSNSKKVKEEMKYQNRLADKNHQLYPKNFTGNLISDMTQELLKLEGVAPCNCKPSPS